MSMQEWAITASRNAWRRQTGQIAMLKGEAERARRPDGAPRAPLLIERGSAPRQR